MLGRHRPPELRGRPGAQRTPPHHLPLDAQHPQQPRRDGVHPLVTPAGPVHEPLAQPRLVLGEFGRGRLPAPRECGQRGLLHLRQPGRVRRPRRRHVLDQRGPFPGGHREAGRGVHDGRQTGGEHEHGVPHAVHPDQRPLLVQRPLGLLDGLRGLRQSRPHCQVHGRRIGAVQRDEGFGDLLRALGPRRPGQPMPQPQPSAPLRHPDVPQPVTSHRDLRPSRTPPVTHQ